MSTKPKAARFFLRRVERPVQPSVSPADDSPFEEEDAFPGIDFRPPQRDSAEEAAQSAAAESAVVDEDALAAIAAEGLTGRQLRRARLLAQAHLLPFTSDLHAVYLLRQAGHDPFAQELTEGSQTGSDMPPPLTSVPGPEIPNEKAAARALARLPGDQARLPSKARPIAAGSTDGRADAMQASEILRIQQDIARRRRRKLALLYARLFIFVFLPTMLAGYYFYRVATPIYATYSQFAIQNAEQPQGGGLGGLLAGTGFASSPEANAVQGYLQSPEAMLRLEADLGFREHFQDPKIDALQRLPADATESDAYAVYQDFVKISHDPSEGIIKLEVMAADPETAAAWANQLIKYAEEQIDQLTQRMRENQMRDAQTGYDDAQAKLTEAQRHLIELQESFKVLSSDTELGLITSQISQLESQLTQEKLSLAQMESNENPNQARMEPVKRRITTLEEEIATLRARMTEADPGAASLAEVQGELLMAQADVETRQMILAQSLQTMELARIEAGRQVRYLTVSVSPTPPDEPTYPKAFENTLVSMLILLGIYLMVSMTAAILREQVSS